MSPKRKTPTPNVRGPFFRRLAPAKMRKVLDRNHIGRMAFMVENHIELQPVSYVYSNGALYGRTSFGAKYIAWMHRPYVVFEVDESEGPYDWRSVVVRGT